MAKNYSATTTGKGNGNGGVAGGGGNIGSSNASSSWSSSLSETTAAAASRKMPAASSSSRRRAVSIAEAQPSVETVMAKAKRAAQSLWMLLHAQNCTLGQKCPHTGCQEAKLLHLHLKTCKAGPNGDCPMMYHGCDQSRKLLSHYRRCRSMRARQTAAATTTSGASSLPKGRRSLAAGGGADGSESQHCLVCSLVARQARTMICGSGGGSPTASSSKGPVFKKNSSNVKISYVVSTADANVLGRRGSTAKMPPPPPRDGGSGGLMTMAGIDSLSRLYETAKQLDGNGEEEESDQMATSTAAVLRRERAVSDAETYKNSIHYHPKNGDDDSDRVQGRARSASCGNAPPPNKLVGKSSSPPTFETIAE